MLANEQICPTQNPKRGESLTYTTRETLTYVIGETLIPLKVLKRPFNHFNFNLCALTKKERMKVLSKP